MNPLKDLEGHGQSIWYDYIRRNLLTGGKLDQLINEDGLKGMTSNPAIFEKAIAGSTDYAAALQDLGSRSGVTPMDAYEQLALQDIRMAAERLQPVYEASGGTDGYVSLEVSPRLANDSEATLEEARRLWTTLDLPNVMIKVPATVAGLTAMESLLVSGINVNATLLFSIEVYEQVALAYIRAMERRLQDGSDLGAVASVASFFISRIDTAVDKLVAARVSDGAVDPELDQLRRVEGQVAIASARLAYQRYKRLFAGERWQALAAKGARPQRLLWASTGVKNPAYRDVRYVEELIGPDTVNTVTPATLDAFREHGKSRASLEEHITEAEQVMSTLQALDISLDAITGKLRDDGVRLFVEAFDKLLAAVEKGLVEAAGEGTARHSYSLTPDLSSALETALGDWEQNSKVRRLWARDATLWSGGDEADWLDWLDITREQVEHLGDLRRLSERVEGENYQYVVLLGMGGSSMAPEVIRESLGVAAHYPDLKVLDSTDPAEVRAVEEAVDLARTLVIVSSKSGSTLEPNILKAYFFQRMTECVGSDQAANHFIAVTDPGSDLEQVARKDGFRQVFYGKPKIGGRFSALSNFGLVPAALIGVDLKHFLEKTLEMVEACADCVPAGDNPGVVLGCIMGLAANLGRDKMTLIASPGIESLGAWLEQLVAESTGKQGKAVIPLDGEAVGSPPIYGDDRIFVYVRLSGTVDDAQELAVAQLEQAGQPVVRINVPDVCYLGQEFFRWEIATAVAGSIMDINPFDQPDVEASKIETRKLTDEYESRGRLPAETPLAEGGALTLYTDARNARELIDLAGDGASVAALLHAHLGRIGAGDYVALLAYIARNTAHHSVLQEMRHKLRDTYRVATCLGFGPRFLHSTGQAYKGGPNSGVFLQITCDDAMDLPVPGHAYTFGVVKAAQARGDFEVLAERGRRALRVHIGGDTLQGLHELGQLLQAAAAS